MPSPQVDRHPTAIGAGSPVGATTAGRVATLDAEEAWQSGRMHSP